MENIGQEIRRIRESKNLKLVDVAERAGISKGSLSFIENGVNSPTFDTLKKILKVLDISIPEFFSTDQNLSDLPPDILELVSKEENYGLLKEIIGMKNSGFSNELIIESMGYLNNALDDIRKKVRQGIDEKIFVVDLLGGHTEEEMKEKRDRLKEKMKDPNYTPPWKKK